MPYTALLQRSTRASLGVELRGNVVVIDEAHNVIEAITESHAALLSAEQVRDSEE
jgi:chromosome transmission fidelity protein 1